MASCPLGQPVVHQRDDRRLLAGSHLTIAEARPSPSALTRVPHSGLPEPSRRSRASTAPRRPIAASRRKLPPRHFERLGHQRVRPLPLNSPCARTSCDLFAEVMKHLELPHVEAVGAGCPSLSETDTGLAILPMVARRLAWRTGPSGSDMSGQRTQGAGCRVWAFQGVSDDGFNPASTLFCYPVKRFNYTLKINGFRGL